MSSETMTSEVGLEQRTPENVRKNRHVEMLVISSIALVASFLLSVGPEKRVQLGMWPTIAMPKLCFSKELLGSECPGCGLTRSFVHIAHWDWRGAWEMHRLGAIMFFATAVQVPYRIVALTRPGREILSLRLAKWFGNTLIALLILNWLVGLVFVQTWPGN